MQSALKSKLALHIEVPAALDNSSSKEMFGQNGLQIPWQGARLGLCLTHLYCNRA